MKRSILKFYLFLLIIILVPGIFNCNKSDESGNQIRRSKIAFITKKLDLCFMQKYCIKMPGGSYLNFHCAETKKSELKKRYFDHYVSNLSWHPSEKKLLLSCATLNDPPKYFLMIYDVMNDKSINILEEAYDAIWSYDGNFIYFTSIPNNKIINDGMDESINIYKYSIRTKKRTLIFKTNDLIIGNISNYKNKIVFYIYRKIPPHWGIGEIDIDSFYKLKLLFQCDEYVRGAKINTNGQRIIFMSTLQHDSGFYVFDLKNSKVQKITNKYDTDHMFYAISWSYDNKKICFISQHEYHNESLYLMDIDSKEDELIYHGDFVTNTAWSPDYF